MPKVFISEKQKDCSRLQDNLKLIRGNRTNEQMGVIIGCSRDTFTRKLRNPEKLTYKDIKRLCDFFHVDIAAFCKDKLKIQ